MIFRAFTLLFSIFYAYGQLSLDDATEVKRLFTGYCHNLKQDYENKRTDVDEYVSFLGDLEHKIHTFKKANLLKEAADYSNYIYGILDGQVWKLDSNSKATKAEAAVARSALLMAMHTKHPLQKHKPTSVNKAFIDAIQKNYQEIAQNPAKYHQQEVVGAMFGPEYGAKWENDIARYILNQVNDNVTEARRNKHFGIVRYETDEEKSKLTGAISKLTEEATKYKNKSGWVLYLTA